MKLSKKNNMNIDQNQIFDRQNQSLELKIL